ncbi:MAG TPA: hypothetical protein VFO89_10050 [Thermoanaerobaculia bacterium]|nr:hypothetical protein [Thermoanaerobaculia bacterium]
MRTLSLVALLVLSLPTLAEIRIGHYVLLGADLQDSAATPYTVVDISSPASENGTINAVAVRTGGGVCTDAFRIRFFRPGGGVMTLFADRGPFSINNANLVKVAMTPPVHLLRGDLIAVTALKPCMRAAGQALTPEASALRFPGASDFYDLGAGTTLENYALAVYGAASASAQVRTQVIVVAGAARGANDSLFKTDIFLANPRNAPSAGHLVYHPEGVSDTGSDSRIDFSMEPARSRTYEDFVSVIGRSGGKGSVDIYTTIGFEPPYAGARVYDDAGPQNGTKGFSFDALTPAEALQPFRQGVLFTPADETRFRMNVGIRTLDDPATIDFLLLDLEGGQRALATKTYPRNYYTQIDAAGLLGVAPRAGDTIIVYPKTAPVFVYGSIIDNRSNDPSIQFAKVLQ